MSSKSALASVLIAIGGVVAGFIAARLLAEPATLAPAFDLPRGEPAAQEAPGPRADATEPASPRTSVDARQETARAPGERTSASDELFSAALLAYARDGIREGWRKSRGEELPDERLAAGMLEFEKTVRGLPESIGARLAEMRTREEALAEDARRGGAFALLEAMAKSPAPVTALVEDAEGFEELFARGSPEVTVRGDALEGDLGKHLESGKTFEYGVGVFEVKIDLRGKEPLSDVTISGAGMNRTLLVLKENIFSSRPLRRFSIRDCTVFTNDNYLFDQRGAPATILLERLRVIGFDMGAGGSCALGFAGSPGLVLLARDSRFEGGYGRSPEHGKLMDVRTPALAARLERCVVDRTALDLDRLPSGATMLFVDSAMVDLTDPRARFAASEQRAQLEQSMRTTPGITWSSTSISFFDNARFGLGPTDWTVPGRDLNALFPGWKQQLTR